MGDPRLGQWDRGRPLTWGFTSSFPVTANMVERPKGVQTAAGGEAEQGVPQHPTPPCAPRRVLGRDWGLSPTAQAGPRGWGTSGNVPRLTQQQQHAEERDAGVEVGQVELPEVCGGGRVRPVAPSTPSLQHQGLILPRWSRDGRSAPWQHPP